MGNSTSGKSNLFGSSEKKACRSNNCVVDRTNVMYLDPRSPSEGIVRTPIQLDRPENGWKTQDCLSVSADTPQNRVGFSKSANVGDVCVIELNNFETLDGFLTEDDSIHRPDLVDEGVSALSDTDMINKAKNTEHLPNQATAPKARLSWMERLGRRKSARDSPSLFVRMRQKHDFEKRRANQCHQHGGDGMPRDSGQSPEKSQTEDAVSA
ncbi:hypothetical protein D915_009541 [Fasciola hepatica]|uniref:Uncharacterized protein n=1 Tax=Fasciola hepatica TaxID=6192 RepID=A0A2H1BV67_FASHE|nr:hypothetical protein D915_009541 [Fasciola hepatica]